MWRKTIALAGTLALFLLLAGCGSKGGDDVAGPDVPLRLGVVTADVNGGAWASVDAAQKPLAECYLFVLGNGDSVLHLVARRAAGHDTLASAIFMDLPKPREGAIPLRDVSTATWYVQQLSGADTLQGWGGTGAGHGGSLILERLSLAADSAYARFAFLGVSGPDSVRVTNGHFHLAYNVVHVTEPGAVRAAQFRSRLGASVGSRRSSTR